MNSKVPQDDMKKTNGVGNRKSKYDNNKETRLGQAAQKKKNKSSGKKSQKKRVRLVRYYYEMCVFNVYD